MPDAPELLPELLDRCRSSDRGAIGRLVGRFYNYAFSLASALVDDPHMAEDVTQDSMLTMLTHLHHLREPQALPGWLRQIVRSRAREARRRMSQALIQHNHADPQPDPIDNAVVEELRQHVRHAIQQLGPVNQQTSQLYYLDELDQSRIASQLDVPLGTVKRRLHDARVKLRKLLDQQRRDADLPL